MKSPDSSHPRRSMNTVAWAAILIVFAISILALVGRMFGIPILKSIEPRWIEVRVVTALCLGMCAAALALIHRPFPERRRRTAATVLGSTVGLVGLLTVLVYLFELRHGYEISLTGLPLLNQFLAPADRMASWTAGLFVVTGCALVLLAAGGRRAAQVAHALALPMALASYLVPVSDLLGVESIHALLDVPVALNTGIAFCALSMAIFCLRPDTWLMRELTEDHAGGLVAQRLFPALLIIPLVIGWLRLYGERQAIFGSEAGAVLVAMAYTVCLLSFLWLSARAVNRADRRRLAGEIALRESERRYATTLASLGDAVIATDADRRITFLNRVAAELTGWSPDEAVGRSIRDVIRILDERTHEPAEDVVERVLLEGRAVQCADRTLLAVRDGREVPIEGSAAPIKDDAGQVNGVVLVFRDVTPERQAQAALHESDARLRSLYSSMSEGLAVYEMVYDEAGRARDYRILDVNPAFERITGVPRVQAVGLLGSASDGGYGPPYFDILSAVAETGQPTAFETYFPPLEKHFQVSAFSPAKGMVATVFEDITERKRVEVALRESKEHFRALTEALPQIVWTAGAEGSIEWLNQHWYAYTGQGPAVGKDWSWQAVVHPEDLPGTLASWERARESGAVYESEVRLRGEDGVYRWFLTRAWPLCDSAGNVVRWVGTSMDIQDMKLASKVLHQSRADLEALVRERTATLANVNRDLTHTLHELRASQDAVAAERRRFHDVLEMLPVYVALLTPDYHMPFANRFFRDRFGDSGGRRCFESLFGRTEPCEDCESFTVLKTMTPHSWNWTGPDGRSYEIADFPFTGVDGLPIVMEVGIDVTERRRVEVELRSVNLKLEQRATQLRALTTKLAQAADRERRRLAEILHDHLQQLLVATRFSADSLRRTATDESQRGNATQMIELLDQAIAASRSLTIELSPPDLHEAGLTAGLLWLARWMESNHNFKVEVVADAPEENLSEDLLLVFFQAVRELLFNAVKHSGVHEARVVLDAESPDEICVTVEDDGVGFDAETQEASGAPGGFGLLNIRERLGYLDGRVTIDSGPGRGTRVVLTAPAIRAYKPEPTPQAALRPRAADPEIPGGGDRNIRILVADDQAVVRQGLVQLLGGQPGLEVVGEAVDGYDAVEKTRALRPDVVLIDLTMPRMNGLEATKLITSEMPRVRVIGLSVHLGEHVARQMTAAGAARYLNKDTPIEEITAAIREACRGTANETD